MSDPTIFDSSHQEPEVVVQPVVAPSTPSIPPELVEFVGVGKKYQTVEAALAAFAPAQNHIAKLEADYAALKAELEGRKTTQELLDEIKSGIPKGDTAPKQELNQDTLVKVVEQVLTQKESKKVAETNQSTVVNTFREIFGDKAEAQYNKVAEEAGLSIAALNQLARTSPQAVIRLAGINKTPVPQVGKIRSDVNPLALSPTNTAPSAKVAKTNTTRDVLNAWRAAGEKVKQQLG